jgi:hypothetical protein
MMQRLEAWLQQRRVDRAVLLTLFVVTTALRLWLVLRLHKPGDWIVSDMWVYDHRAQRMGASDLGPWDTFTPVGYPAFLASVYALVGREHAVVGVLQALMSGGLAVFTHRIAWHTSGRAFVALLAGVAVTAHLPLAFYAGLLLTEVSAAFWLALGVWLLLRVPTHPGWFGIVAAGLVLGLAATIRPNLLAFYVLLPVWLWVAFRDRRALRVGALAALGGLVPIGTVCAYNSSIAERPTSLATNGGLNFYLNVAEVRTIHYQEPDHGHAITPIPNLVRYTVDERTRVPFHEQGHYFRRGFQLIAERPARLVRALDNLVEGAGLGQQDFWPGWPGRELLLKRSAWVLFWLAVAPALLYLFVLLVRGRLWQTVEAPRLMLGLAVFAVTVTMWLFLGDPRVRVPFDPLLIVLALDGTVRVLVWGVTRLRGDSVAARAPAS